MKYYTMGEICKMFAVDVQAMRREIRCGRFPPGVLITPRSRRWSKDVIDKWIKSAKTKKRANSIVD